MMNKRSGFTLVELIVVIAILGILAGIAIPVYSGYIKKANQAADEVLLSAVNTAFGAACLENNDSPKGKNISDLAITDGALDDMPIYKESFDKYFEGNDGSKFKFKFFTRLQYIPDEGFFVGVGPDGSVSTGTKTLTYMGKSIVYTDELVAAYLDSNYYHNDPASTRQWADTVNGLAQGVSANSASVNSLKGDAAFQAYLTSNGKNAADLTGEEVGQALVGYAASKISTLDADNVINSLTGNWSDDLHAVTALISGKAYGSSSFSEKAVGAALLFGLTGAYANSDYAMDDPSAQGVFSSGVSDYGSFASFMGTLDADNYKDYLDDCGKADLNGLLSVMSLVNSNSGAVSEIMGSATNGFSSEEIIGLVQAILGTANP